MDAFSKDASLLGLVARRRKWHICEHNFILASWDNIPASQKERALRGLIQHRAGFQEAEAILDRLEPSWGNEREITETYLNWEPSENGGSQSNGEKHA